MPEKSSKTHRENIYKGRTIAKQRDRDPARPSHDAQAALATMHGQASRHGSASRLLATRGSSLKCAAMQPYRTTVSSAIFHFFGSLDARGFLEPLMLLEIALEVFFSIKTQ